MAAWVLYGANGYTGELIAREARVRGLQPILAGRNRVAVERLARELGCESRCFALDDLRATRAGITGAALVLHCAGPFSATAEPMLQACLAQSAHYLDITGEIEVFERAQRLDAEARRAGIVLCPGAGFDVVPTDCLAATLSRAMPDAVHLALAYDSRSAVSRGTAKTMIEGLRTGTQVRVGRLRTANGYTLTGHAALGIAARLLQTLAPAGYQTPSQLMGADYVATLPGSTPISVTEQRHA